MIKSLFVLVFTFLSSTLLADSKPVKIVLTDSNTIALHNSFNDESVAVLAQKAKEMDVALPEKAPIYLVLYSGGGSIDAGLELIDNLRSLSRPVHTVSLFSASMAFQTVQGLNRRYITNSGVLMSHKARGGFSGEFPGQLDSRYGFWIKRVANLDAHVVKRTKGKHTAQSYASLVENEYWCEGQDCVEQGFIDRIARVSCDSTLSGRTKTEEKFMFRGASISITLETSKCPVITGVLSFDVAVNGVSIYTLPKDQYFYNNPLKDFSPEDLKVLREKVEEIKASKFNRSVEKSY